MEEILYKTDYIEIKRGQSITKGVGTTLVGAAIFVVLTVVGCEVARAWERVRPHIVDTLKDFFTNHKPYENNNFVRWHLKLHDREIIMFFEKVCDAQTVLDIIDKYVGFIEENPDVTGIIIRYDSDTNEYKLFDFDITRR